MSGDTDLPVDSHERQPPVVTANTIIGVSGDTQTSTGGSHYEHPVVNNHDEACSNVGHVDIASMAQQRNRYPPHDDSHHQDNHNGTGRLDSDIDNVNSPPGVGDIPVPTGYRIRDRSWFEKGRIVQIWDDGTDRHENMYVLLDKNNEGLHLCLHVHGREHAHFVSEEDYADPRFMDHHALIQERGASAPEGFQDQDKGTILYLHRRMTARNELWVHLGHADNIPFERYHCADRGALDPRSTRRLRYRYLEWWADRWDFGLAPQE